MAVITNTNSQRMCMLSRSASNAPCRIIKYNSKNMKVNKCSNYKHIVYSIIIYLISFCSMFVHISTRKEIKTVQVVKLL